MSCKKASSTSARVHILNWLSILDWNASRQGGGGGPERNVQKKFSAAKSICESSLIQREIVSGQSIPHLYVSKSVTKVICFL